MESNTVEIKCSYDKLVPLNQIKPHPRNCNMHPQVQKKGLAETIKANSIRHPLIISNQSGFLISGHCRLEVYKALGLQEAPVCFQDFDSEAQEYKFLVSDNESQRKSWLDAKSFFTNIEELKLQEAAPLEEFGIYDEITKPPPKNASDPNPNGKEVKVQCPKCQHLFNI